MKFQPLDGANEIGAPSTLIEIEGVRLLVDAGIRMGPGQDSPHIEVNIPHDALSHDNYPGFVFMIKRYHSTSAKT